jgi:hypothetical protein
MRDRKGDFIEELMGREVELRPFSDVREVEEVPQDA